PAEAGRPSPGGPVIHPRTPLLHKTHTREQISTSVRPIVRCCPFLLGRVPGSPAPEADLGGTPRRPHAPGLRRLPQRLSHARRWSRGQPVCAPCWLRTQRGQSLPSSSSATSSPSDPAAP